MKEEVEHILHMVGGLGENSYASNSQIQEKVIRNVKKIIERSIVDVYCALLPECLSIADLGCSSGPTTFMVIFDVLTTVSNICHRLNQQPPEVVCFLNDLPRNDFNTIFQSLPMFEKKLKEKSETFDLSYYVLGVPGSFYGRLFPKQSIHFMHSSYSLHWLSRVPQGLQSDGSAPMNKGNIYIAKSSSSYVLQAYLEQFQGDFSKFLDLRAKELVSRGQLVLTFLGRSLPDPLTGKMSVLLGLITEALNSIVAEGLLEQEKVDEFDIPFYAPSVDEVRQVILSEGSFLLHQLHVCKQNWDPYDNCNEEFIFDDKLSGGNEECAFDNKLSGENAAKCVRAALEPLLANHFGESIIDTLFSRYSENVAKHLLMQKTKLVNFTITLEKKSG